MSHVLWLLKFDEYSSTKASTLNKYIPQKGFDFVRQFQTITNDNTNISLIYAASNGPYLLYREKTDLPTKKWNMTIITKHSINNTSDTSDISMSLEQFKQTSDFITLKQQFGIQMIYNVCFKMKEKTLAFLHQNYNKILSIAPSYPYASMSYEWLANNKNMEQVTQYIKLLQHINQPFVMLNLMQIIDEKADTFYSQKVTPLVNGVGGKALFIGDAKCIPNHYWTKVLLVSFPNTKKYWNLWTSQHYMKIAKHKLQSTKDILLQMTIPIYCHTKYSKL